MLPEAAELRAKDTASRLPHLAKFLTPTASSWVPPNDSQVQSLAGKTHRTDQKVLQLPCVLIEKEYKLEPAEG